MQALATVLYYILHVQHTMNHRANVLNSYCLYVDCHRAIRWW